MTDHKPLFRKIIDAIHELQRRTETIHERAAATTPSWPACCSRTPRGGTAVSPYHAVFAAHYPLSVGGILRFGAEERVIERVDLIGGDLGVARWKSPIAATPMRILPWDWPQHIPTKRTEGELRKPLLAWRGNQHGKLFRSYVNRIAGDSVNIQDSEGAIIAGDSGSPIFLALPQPVLLGCLASGNGGSNIAQHWRPLYDATDWRVREADWD